MPDYTRTLRDVDQLYAQRDVSGNLAASITKLETVLAKEPENYDALWRLARSYSEVAAFGHLSKKEIASAFSKGEAAGAQAITVRSDAIEGYLWHAAVMGKRAELGNNLAALGAVQTILLDMEEVMALEPACPTAYYVLATVHRQAPPIISIGNLDNAQRYIDRAVSLNPHSVRFYHESGLIALARKDKAGAIKAFEAAIALPPEIDDDSADARYLRQLQADARAQIQKLRKKR